MVGKEGDGCGQQREVEAGGVCGEISEIKR